MRSPFVRSAFFFLVPGGLLFAAMAVVTEKRLLTLWLESFGDLYAYAAVATALLLGWRFDRSRLVFASVVLALGAALLRFAATQHDNLSWLIPEAVATLLPVNLLLTALAKERGIFTWHGAVRWAFIALQPLAIWTLILTQRFDWLGLFDAELLPPHLLPMLKLEQPALLAYLLALLAIGVQCVRRQDVMESGLFWSLALTAYALLRSPSPTFTTAAFATAILILAIAVIEASHSMAFRDELTGLPGRRALNHTLLKLGSRYTIAMLDVDHFKKFNDTYGHDVGDQVLKMVAGCIAGVRGGGKPFRFGGEEFTVVFPGKERDECLPHLERLREAIADSGFTVRGPDRPKKKSDKPSKGSKKSVKITISIGAAEREGEQRDPQQVIKAADKALYRAKEAGRNCVST